MASAPDASQAYHMIDFAVNLMQFACAIYHSWLVSENPSGYKTSYTCSAGHGVLLILPQAPATICIDSSMSTIINCDFVLSVYTIIYEKFYADHYTSWLMCTVYFVTAV